MCVCVHVHVSDTEWNTPNWMDKAAMQKHAMLCNLVTCSHTCMHANTPAGRCVPQCHTHSVTSGVRTVSAQRSLLHVALIFLIAAAAACFSAIHWLCDLWIAGLGLSCSVNGSRWSKMSCRRVIVTAQPSRVAALPWQLCCAVFSRKFQVREGRLLSTVQYLMKNLSDVAIRVWYIRYLGSSLGYHDFAESLKRPQLSGTELERSLWLTQEGNSTTESRLHGVSERAYSRLWMKHQPLLRRWIQFERLKHHFLLLCHLQADLFNDSHKHLDWSLPLPIPPARTHLQLAFLNLIRYPQLKQHSSLRVESTLSSSAWRIFNPSS